MYVVMPCISFDTERNEKAFLCLLACLPVFVCLSACLPLCPSVLLLFLLCVCLSICLSVCLPVLSSLHDAISN